MVLQDRRHDLVAAQEVDQQHARDGIAAKLVERDDPATRGLVGTHSFCISLGEIPAMVRTTDRR